MTTPDTTLLDAALAHAARGWRVFPLRRGDKRPAVKDWEPRATTDPTRIERAWSTGAYNVGIATGPSNLVVVDLDQPKPGQVPPLAYRQPGIRDGSDVLAMLCEALDQPLPADTYAVRTASGGMHLYYAAPAGTELRNSASRLGWLIDTRAHGGYVVGAGSTVVGRKYTALVPDTSPARLPEWITERLGGPDPTPHESAGPVANPSGYATAALRGELERVLSSTPDVNRNHNLYVAARSLGELVGAGLLARELVENALAVAGEAIGLDASEIPRTIRSGLNSGEGTPRRPAA